MNLITQTFYVLSSALLIPMMLALLWALTRILMLIGQVMYEYLERARQKSARRTLEHCLIGSAATWPELPGNGVLCSSLKSLIAGWNDNSRMAFSISQAELQWQQRLDVLRSYIRNGPALGLMGTLIPLGPALVGLAVGDIQTMSSNLVIAFSTTVIGLLVGMIAASLTSLRRRWYQADAALLNFAADRLSSLNCPPAVAGIPAAARQEAAAASANHPLAIRSGEEVPA
ncbi:MAG: MotA/TolQ/ExbB proton channel family protein [Planctomyces sp.]|nr:MotA/TolQ/ExbB proton channel family protein [Planctomyces sp.]